MNLTKTEAEHLREGFVWQKPNRMTDRWYEIANVDEVDSPALLVYPDRAEENVRRMIAMVGDMRRLRPHMKTHKLPEIIRMQLAHGITKFKCATIAEAEMTADCGAADVLLAHQPIGPKVQRFIQLLKKFPQTKFSTIADDAEVIRALSSACAQAKATVEVLLDLDCGMHRTGIAPGAKAVELYQLLGTLPGLKPGGLHAYDGHIRESDPTKRAEICHAAFAPVRALRTELLNAGLPTPRIVAGGTPTFPIHAQDKAVECSPGTCVFWDAGYGAKCPDMEFLNAALVLTRVVSKPGGNRLCLDLGHKAIASENPHPRVVFLNLPDAQAVSHSEEHLVVETERAGEIELAACIYGVPWHVCPTVALHSEAVIIRGGRAQERWGVVGRNRRLTV
ncbi:MAG TPA: D-TA family PLP-dependent enzyme [Verrucomicrobiae bacterium]|nr:D-TA family PLP-dependent enzyme [Verrucomicrobiae bacterium]